MTNETVYMGAPECKYFCPDQGLEISEGFCIEGYASLFGVPDQGGDIVQKGAFATSLKHLEKRNEKVRMLWQHDPNLPIGVWHEIKEDEVGLWVKGRILNEIEKGREVAALLEARAIDGLSIGYRTIKSERDGKGRRLLSELELWEVSMVTFPMLREARVAAKSNDDAEHWRELAVLLEEARLQLAGR